MSRTLGLSTRCIKATCADGSTIEVFPYRVLRDQKEDFDLDLDSKIKKQQQNAYMRVLRAWRSRPAPRYVCDVVEKGETYIFVFRAQSELDMFSDYDAVIDDSKLHYLEIIGVLLLNKKRKQYVFHEFTRNLVVPDDIQISDDFVEQMKRTTDACWCVQKFSVMGSYKTIFYAENDAALLLMKMMLQ